MIAAEENLSLETALAFYFECLDRGESVEEAGLVAKFPQHAEELQSFFADQRQLNIKVRKLSSTAAVSHRLSVRCPNCHHSTEVAVDSTLRDLKCDACGSRFSLLDPSATTTDAPTVLKMGRFDLVERLGVGAFGSVWKARDNELDRIVAVKIPRQGGMTPTEQEKFFREARAAAQLRHPHIVSVHEVGRDGDSVYIVSDFVQGVTLADWLTGQQPTNREAAELCATIADALEHAHDKGVVHRDLKPANIMIDGAGQPHLMDFGLARRDAGEVTMTMDGHVLGTPAFMSPEQAEGKAHAADRRSDVYSLGVILFQLLTGELPFRGNARMLMHQVIHDEPPSPRKLNAFVKKDLETITLKCLEKVPARRYQSGNELANELRCFLADRPINARPISRSERTARWVRRNKIVSALITAVFLALLAGATISTYFAIDARARATEAIVAQQESEAARTSAESRRKEAEAVSNFLEGAFKSAHPGRMGRSVTLVDILDRAGKDIEKKLPGQPVAQAALLHSMGASWLGLGMWREAAEDFEKALELREKAIGRQHPETLTTMGHVAYAYRMTGRLTESTALYEEILAGKKRLYGANHATVLATMEALAANYRIEKRVPEAIDLLNTVIHKAHSTLGADNAVTLTASESLADIYRDAGQFDKAIEIRQQTLAQWQKKAPNTVYSFGSMAGLAAANYYAAHYEDAVVLYEAVVAGQKYTAGPEHTDTLNSMGMLASTYYKLGEMEKAIPLYEQVFVARRKALGLDDPVTILAMNGLVSAFTTAHRIEEAKKLYDEVLATEVDSPRLLNSAAWTLATSSVDVLRDGKRAVELATKACELTDYKNSALVDTLAAAHAEAGDFDAAVKWSEKAIELAKDGDNAKDRATLQKALERYKAKRPAWQPPPNGKTAGNAK